MKTEVREKVKKETLYRSITLDEGSRGLVDEENRTVELSFSSEDKLVERYFGMEQLVHEEGSVDLHRLNDGGALLLDHDSKRQIGVVEKAFIDTKEKKGRAQVRFSRSSLGDEVFKDVMDGIRKNVSVGFRINKYEEEDREGQLPLIRVTEWTPFEISFVSIPADEYVGVGRAENLETEKKETKPNTETREETKMENETKEIKAPVAPAVDESQIRAKVQKAERDRVANITAVVGKFNTAKVREMADKAITDGTDSGAFYLRVLEHLGKAKEVDTDQGPEASRSHLGMDRKDLERYSIKNALRGMLKGQDLEGVELEAHRELEKRFGESTRGGVYVPMDAQLKGMAQKRALTTVLGSDGGFLVDQVNMSFIDILRNNMVTPMLGVQEINGLVGNVAMPKQTGAATLYWISDDEATTESEQTFGQLTMTPRTASANTAMSRQLLLQSDPSVDSLVQNDLAKVIAIGKDLAILNGSGTNGQPQGIIGTTGVNSVSTSSHTWAKIVNLETQVAASNGLDGSIAMVTTPAVRGTLKTSEKATNTAQFIWNNNEVNGYPAFATTQMPANNIIFGDFSNVVVGNWGVLELRTIDQGTNYKKGEVEILAFLSMDVSVRQPAKFSVSTDFS